ncbi:cobalamin B12-binding domain-containing protein [Methanolobus zinderi]|uniref:Cobalamin B12-binding domain-containing protein n=1 Tax=Methanolobus zinderi TaxID=536044 RepID=A0A7D5I556_9EURY|nr:methanol--corrinoid protein MtaC [Methanolobus zinderi]QLC50021.1 cobalamin B12-binding domain-containing protein [Methanolobus zinderi]
MIDIDPSSILVRYNVKLESERSPDDVAREMFPEDELIRNIVEAVFEGDEDEVIMTLQKAVDQGKDAIDLIDDALIVGMDIVSQLYEEGMLFLPDVMISSQAMTDGIEYCKKISGRNHEYKGKVVSFVVEGDVHDIGKKILTVFLRSNGYEVIDLGSDVPVDEVVGSVIENKPIMLTGTALMTTTMYSFKEIRDRLFDNGVNIPFICGGGAVTQDFVDRYDLGIYCDDAAIVPKIADEVLKNATIDDLRTKFHSK